MEYDKAWAVANPEKAPKKYREWYAKNKSHVLSRTKKYALSHRDQRKNIALKYRARNPERVLEWARNNYWKHRSKILERNATRGKERSKRAVAWRNKEAIRLFYKKAEILSAQTGIPHDVDHIIPLMGKLVSGLHVENNLRVIPASENRKKNNQFDESLLEICETASI